MPGPEPSADRARGDTAGLLGPRIAGLAVLALGIVLLVSAFGIARGGGYSVVGPATIPLVVAVGIIVLAGAFVVRTTVRPDEDLRRKAVEEETACHWATVGLVGAALIGYALALDGVELGDLEVPGLGYIVATALFLPLTARILGSRSPVRDVIAGVVVALVIYFGFTEFLGVRLPDGILGPVL